MIRKKKLRRHITGGEGKIGEADLPREKSLLVAYVFWGFPGLGPLGCHRYYLGRFLTGILFILTLGGFFGLFWIIDAFRLPKLTRSTNRQLWERWFAKHSDKWTESTGTVRDVSRRTMSEMGGNTVTPKEVLNFRIEELDGDGNIIQVVPVELIGNQILGNLRDGDSIEVKGRMSKEHILRALTAKNVTTNSSVVVQF